MLTLFLEFSKTFDSMHNDTLLYQLDIANGVQDLPKKWMSLYLTNRCYFINQYIFPITIYKNKYSIPKGSIFVPTLFIIYVNNQQTKIQNGHVMQKCRRHTYLQSLKLKNELEVKLFLLLSP